MDALKGARGGAVFGHRSEKALTMQVVFGNRPDIGLGALSDFKIRPCSWRLARMVPTTGRSQHVRRRQQLQSSMSCRALSVRLALHGLARWDEAVLPRVGLAEVAWPERLRT